MGNFLFIEIIDSYAILEKGKIVFSANNKKYF